MSTAGGRVILVDYDPQWALEFAALGEVLALEGELGVPGRYSFTRSGLDVPWTPTRALWPRHHLYAGAADAPGISHHLIFRGALVRDRQLAARYGELKQLLAARYPEDVDAYCEAKTEFIREALSEARSFGV